ncbi:haloalkane dehalogenase [Mucilaginibacter sp. HD30]
MKKLSAIVSVLSLFFTTMVNAQQSSPIPIKKINPMISSKFNYPKKHTVVLGKDMAYVETGSGDPIVFLHGNPTSSYLWRNVIPYLEKQGRCIAPDLIGMGDSQKLQETGPEAYSFLEQSKYLDALLEKLGVNKKITFVAHDWGSALAFYWAYRHPAAVKGIVYMEAIVTPLSWEGMPEMGRNIFKMLRSPAGEKLVLEQNSFIEVNLPNTIQRALTKEEMDEYRRPFLQPGEGRRVMLSWARQLPFEGDTSNVVTIVNNYSNWLSKSQIPKLFIESDPGTMQPNARTLCNTWPAQMKITVKGIHYVQEDSPGEIGAAIAAWYKKIKK